MSYNEWISKMIEENIQKEKGFQKMLTILEEGRIQRNTKHNERLCGNCNEGIRESNYL